ncbi:hypothetical protein BDW22DRAFT_446265 [Trametopsis cervina]|nr:hypothetical protein BDW22DRAFT_446265 [Trametopsis cervina]
MPLFMRSQPLSAFPSRRDEIDAFLSSEVELQLEDSFASNMSLHSPPQSRREIGLPSEDSRDYTPMDISPAPQRVLATSKVQPYRYDEDLTARLPPAPKVVTGRPRSNTASGTQRLFGKDVSNNRDSGYVVVSSKSSDKDKASEKAGKKLQRAALPFEWMQSAAPEPSLRDQSMLSSATKPMDISTSPIEPMDVDMSYASISSSAPESPAPLSAAPTITQFNVNPRYVGTPESPAARERSLSNLFYESVSPRRRSIDGTRPQLHQFNDISAEVESPQQPLHKKKRSYSPPSSVRRPHHLLLNDDALSSSPGLMSSPSVLKLERLAARPVARTLAVGDPLGLNANNKRPRRPVLSAMVTPGDMESMLHTALPQMESAAGAEDREREKGREADVKLRPSERVLPPVRRAFSAMIPASINPMEQSFSSEGDSVSMDGPDMSSPAQAYARRQHVKTIRRCDGTDDFRSITGATALLKRDGEMRAPRKSQEKVEKPVVTERNTPRSKYLTGLSGFGDNEAHGKILPCHRVREDGLMRITVQTVNDLIDGKFDSQIAAFHVIDCRFDYEYNGGHIPGAININTTVGVEELLLGAAMPKPKPSISGDGDKKTVLVFHCEFSCKRAPTFAKHLRSKDRSLNNHVYPRIHYPEVYILEGGYCKYYKTTGERCEPRAYVRMDDPVHAASRKEDLDQFRKGKFGRTKSYAYGDGKNGMMAPAVPKRNSAPSGQVSTLFVAGNAARTRRTNGLLQTLQEDSSGAQHSEDEDTDIGDSPCPPPTKAVGVIFKGKKIPRAPLARAETYGPARMTLGY